METMTPTVFIVDDDPSFCRAVERLLRSFGYRAEAYTSPTEFVNRWQPEQPGCLVLDMRMPDLPGLEVQRRVTSSAIAMPVIFVSGSADVETCVGALRGGAADILLKPFSEEELLAAVDRALEKDAEQRREQDEAHTLREQLAWLTPREMEVFRLVAKGMLNKQIAVVLGTKEGTVKMHRGHVMRKLQLGSVAELVSLANRLGLDDPCPTLHARSGRFRVEAGSGPVVAVAEP